MNTLNLSDYGISVNSGFAFFWGSPLSNWHKSSFFVDDILFHTSEHYMMYRKAMLFNDTVAAASILKSKDPKKIKAIGRQVKDYDDAAWAKVRFDAVYEGCLAKFQQNPDAAKVLLATVGLEIVEASPYDKVWGIGMSANDPRAINKSQWQGDNLLGLVLEKVREQLVKE